MQCFGPVRATEHSLHISDTIQNWLLTSAPRLFNHTDLLQPWLVGAQIPPALAKYFTGELTMTRLVTLIRSGTVDHKEALDRAVQALRAERGSEKRQKTQSPMVYLPHPADLLPGSPAAFPPPTPQAAPTRPLTAFGAAPIGSTPRPAGPRSGAPTPYQRSGGGFKGSEKG